MNSRTLAAIKVSEGIARGARIDVLEQAGSLRANIIPVATAHIRQDIAAVIAMQAAVHSESVSISNAAWVIAAVSVAIAAKLFL